MLMTFDSTLHDERLKSFCDKTNAKLSLLETKIAKQTSQRKDVKVTIPFEEPIQTPPNHASRPVTASACTFCSSKRQGLHNTGCVCLNKLTDTLKKKKQPVRVVKYYVRKPNPVKSAAENSEDKAASASESNGKPKLTKPTLYKLVLHLGTVKEAESKVSNASDRKSARDFNDFRNKDSRKTERFFSSDDEDNDRFGRKGEANGKDKDKDVEKKQIASVFNTLVYVTLNGKRASLHNHKLLQRNGKPAVLQQGKVAEFYIRTEDLGEIKTVDVEVSKSEKRDRSNDSETARSSRPASEASSASVVSTARDLRTKNEANDQTAQQSSKTLVHAFLLHRITVDNLSQSAEAEKQKKTQRERSRTQYLFECGQVLYEGSVKQLRLSNTQMVSERPAFLHKPTSKQNTGKQRGSSAEKSKDKSDRAQAESEYKLLFEADRNLLLESVDVILIAEADDKSDQKQRSQSENRQDRFGTRDEPERRSSRTRQRFTTLVCKPTWQFEKKDGVITMKFRARNLERITQVRIERDRNMAFKKFQLFKLLNYEEIYESLVAMRKSGKTPEGLRETRDPQGARSFAISTDKGKMIDLYDLRVAAKQRSQSLRAQREKARQRDARPRPRSEVRRERGAGADSRKMADAEPEILENVFKLRLPYAVEYAFEFDRIESPDEKNTKQIESKKQFLAFTCSSSKVALRYVRTHLET